MADSSIAPDQLNVVSNNYQDPEDLAYTQWAVAGGRAAADGNVVIPYIYGEDLFTDMAKDLATATTSDHFIYLIGFETQLGTPMGGSTLEAHLTRAIGAGVMVRGLFNGEGTQRALGMKIKDNKPIVDLINSLGNQSGADAKAFLDDHVSTTGAHHQKIVVIQGNGALVAYCGGIDTSRPRESRAGWHDVHCRLIGPAAYDLFTIFDKRWTHNAGLLAMVFSAIKSPMPQAAVGGNVTTYTVQLGQTWPSTMSLPYAPMPEKTVFRMILNGIRRSTRFIYVEDQFMVCNSYLFLSELKTRLAAESFKLQVILTCSDDRADWSLQGQAAYRRKLLLDELRAASPDKVIVCTRKDLYVHAKSWVFDDKFAIIGSANMNNRGYFSDSEVVAGIADKNAGGTRLWFAHRLRMALWMKHLDISEKDALDPEACVDKWKASTAKIDPYVTSPAPSTFDQLKADLAWATIIDPT